MRTLSIRVPTLSPGHAVEYTFNPESRTVHKKGLTAAGSEYKFALEGTLSEQKSLSFLGSGPEELKLWLEKSWLFVQRVSGKTHGRGISETIDTVETD